MVYGIGQTTAYRTNAPQQGGVAYGMAAPLSIDPIQQIVQETNQLAMEGHQVAAYIGQMGQQAQPRQAIGTAPLRKMEQQYIGQIQSQTPTTPPLTSQTTKRSPISESTNSSASEASDKGEALAKTALSKKGQSTTAGPDGGNLACAWIISNVLNARGIEIPKGSAAHDSVDGLAKYLQQTHGAKAVDASQAKAGDIVYNSRHVGMVVSGSGRDTQVLSNSSSKRSFSWKSDINYDGFYGESSKVLRI